MSFLTELATFPFNVLSVIVPTVIVMSFIIYIICSKSSLKKSQGIEKIALCNGPYLLLTAHPDDECMFFAPLVIQLVKRNPQSLHLLCVTTGNYYQKGKIRRKEIYKSCETLGLPTKNVEVLDNSAFLDGDEEWDFQKLLPEISKYMSKVHAKYVFTFDDKGVSGHPNHIAVSKAVRQLLAQEKSKKELPVLLELKTVALYRKYISFCDIIPTLASSQNFFVSSISEILQAQRAMYSHKSQFVWFRALYIFFSRYMMINDFDEVIL